MAKRKKQEEASGGAPEWMATYGDLVTLLMCFFVLLFASSNLDVIKFTKLAASLNDKFVPTLIDTSGGGSTLLDAIGNGILDLPMPMEITDSTEVDMQNNETVDGDESVVEYVDPLLKAAQEELMYAVDDLKTYFAEERMQDIEIEQYDQYLTIEIAGSAMFESGKAELTKEAVESLKIIGESLLQFTENDIWVEGHTDNIPISRGYRNNWHLSSERALVVGEFLVENGYIDGNSLVTTGHGERRPIAENDTAEGRALNRRVEIKVYSTYYSDNN